MLVRMEDDKLATDKERLGPPATDKENWDPQPQTKNWNLQLQIETGIPTNYGHVYGEQGDSSIHI